MLVRSEWSQEIFDDVFPYGVGITGWAVEHRESVLSNQAHLDPRVEFVPGTPIEPEALIVVPLIARGALKGTLNVYRIGEDARFTEEEFELAKRLGDAAALALDNAHIRARLEREAETDSLTGLYNHRYFHERLRRELTRAASEHEHVVLVMMDIDDFKKVNDVFGHAVGDDVLAELADHLRATVRATDVVCRIGGEEFAVILPGSDEVQAVALATRLAKRLDEVALDLAGKISVSIGIAEGPRHAANPRELVACAEAAMMTAKARGKSQVVFFDDSATERPEADENREDVRSIAHLKMLQTLAGKLNRSTDVREIGMAIANELRRLIDYHNCRIFVRDGDELQPIAFQGELTGPARDDGRRLPDPGRRGLHRARGRDGRVAAPPRRLDLRVRAQDRRDRADRGVDHRRADAVRRPRGRRDRRLEARPEPVRHRRPATARGGGGPHRRCGRERRSLRGAAPRGREREGVARVRPRPRRRRRVGSRAREGRRGRAAADGRAARIALAPGLGRRRSRRTGGARLWTAGHESSAITFRQRRCKQFFAQTEPFVLRPEEYAAFSDPPEGGSGSYVVAPFTLEGRWGAIAVAFSPDGEYGDRDLELLGGLAHQAKLAIANASSFAGLERTFLSTVEALANALEARDEYTSSHARWITDMAIRVGSELGLDGDTLKRLELGALFHDIGKIGIPNSVLLKPGPLTEEERLLIETHPELGERIIAPIDQLQDVCGIVRACHERWDGQGYPDQKAGEEIPLEARIIFACDAFHAMTTDRPYRRALPADEALRRLEENAGSQFDPRVVDVCLRVLDAPAK